VTYQPIALTHLKRTVDCTITQQKLLCGQVSNKLTAFHALMNERLHKMNDLGNLIQEHLIFAAL
jgi:hypothetical protein